MSCNGCFGGCLEITPDQCVRYTGIAIPLLNINNGDPLSEITLSITNYLLTVMDGTGIAPVIEPTYLCDVITGYLPVQGVITLNDVLNALMQTVCDLQTQITANTDDLTALNVSYTTDCLVGVTGASKTHDVLQAVIDILCSLSDDLTAISANFANYVPLTSIDYYIAAYLAGQGTSTLMYTKMVPYVAVEYYDDLVGKFDITGAGIGDWTKIYLCNGLNGTPDKRGRVPVGATTMGTNAFNANVDPAISGNPTYALNTLYGVNTITLSTAEMPSHSHTCSTTVAPNPHSHTLDLRGSGEAAQYAYAAASDNDNEHIAIGVTGDTTLTVSTSINTAGSSEAHNNVPPVLACYYLIYLP